MHGSKKEDKRGPLDIQSCLLIPQMKPCIFYLEVLLLVGRVVPVHVGSLLLQNVVFGHHAPQAVLCPNL